MSGQLRTCTRTGCRWPAAASLSYRYDSRQAWLLDLSPAPDPARYDLCPHHADTVTVPRGWQRVDDRTPRPAVLEPSANDRAASRYARLVADLPRLAAQLAGAATPPATEPGRPTARPPYDPMPAGQLALPFDRRTASAAGPLR